MEIRDKPGGERKKTLAIGGLEACRVCPARKRRGGGTLAATRQVVNVEPVVSPRRPANLDPVHWYWEGEGD
jgi:hypothetical protein